MSAKRSEFRELEITTIDRPKDISRFEIDENYINNLANSIKERGLRQPIEVVERNGRFEIVFGDRRFLAHKKIGKTTILARVVELTDKEIAIDRSIENSQRVNLTPMEEAAEFRRIHDDLGLDWDKIGERVGLSGGVVRRRVAMLNFPENVQQAIHNGEIGITIAEQLMRITENGKRDYYLSLAVEHGVTRKVMQMWADDWERDSRQKAMISDSPGLPQPQSLDRAVYITCQLCNGPSEVKECRTITICQHCLKQLNQILNEPDQQ